VLLKNSKEVEITGPHTSNWTFEWLALWLGHGPCFLQSSSHAEWYSSLGLSIKKHLVGKQFARDVAGYRHLTLIYSMPEYVHYCHGGTNVYQWWLCGGLMCYISYPHAICMLKLEESSQHQSITLLLETHLYNIIFRFLHRRWERKIPNWIVLSILQNESTLKYFSEWMFLVLRYTYCVAVPTSCVPPCCYGIGHIIKMQFHTNELHCQHL